MACFILYVILVVMGVCFAILYTQYTVALFVGILVLFPLLSYVFSIISCLFMEVAVLGNENVVHKGEEFDIRVRLRNRTIFPILNGYVNFAYRYVVLGGKQKATKAVIKFQLQSREERVCNLKLKSEYCGAVEIAIKNIVVKDLFGVFLFPKKISKGCKQAVFPSFEQLELDVVRSTAFYNDEYEEFYEDHPGNDPSEIFEIRDYIEGDKLQRIHWKLSSKKDKLMVKEFSDPIVISAIIICDNYSQEKGMELVKEWSALMEKTIQASYTLLMQEVNHYVYWFDGEKTTGIKKEIKSVEDLNACMHQLMKILPYENQTEYFNYLTFSEEVENYQNIFYVGKNNRLLEQKDVHVKVVE